MKRTKNPNKKLNKELDDIVSLIVRKRDGFKCVKCGKQYAPQQRGLTCSHFWSRTKWNTRWDLDNLDTLCLGCHTQSEHDKQGWYMAYKREQLGTRLYNALEKKSNEIAKWSRDEKELMLENYKGMLG